LKISNETKVGMLTALAIALFFVGYNFLKGNDVFSSQNQFYAKYNKVDGLAVSKPVLVHGYQIGRVSKLTLLPNGQILVQFKVNPKYSVPVNTIARLESTDLLGSKAIVFDLGNSTKLATDGDTLAANVEQNLLDKVQPIQKRAEVIIDRLDSVLVSINNILNPNFQKNVDKSFNSIALTLQNLAATTKKVDNIVGNEALRLDAIMANAVTISTNFKNYNKQITSILNNAENVSNEIAQTNFKQTVNSANKAMADLQAAIDKVNNGKGSIGLLLNDDVLYNNLKNSSVNLDKLLIDVKENPKRYVHFSVFGRKKKQ